jgi:hypothetical protein
MEPNPKIYFSGFNDFNRNKPIARYTAERLSAMQSRGEYITDYEKTLVMGYAAKRRKLKIN